MENLVVLTAVVVGLEALRFTPSGLSAITVELHHSSRQLEAGLSREVTARLKAVAFGSVAEQLSSSELNSLLTFTGFLASRKNAKHPILHISSIQ